MSEKPKSQRRYYRRKPKSSTPAEESGTGSEPVKEQKPKPRVKQQRQKQNRDRTQTFSPEEAEQKFALRQQRNSEIDECLHLLKGRLKVFRKGDHVTSYALFNVRFAGESNFRFIINVPLDYPKSPIKLGNSVMDKFKETELDHKNQILLKNVIANFNDKAKQLLQRQESIIVALNYLVYSLHDLQLSPDSFKKMESLKMQLLSEEVGEDLGDVVAVTN